jgi:FkbM family methyltransferase
MAKRFDLWLPGLGFLCRRVGRERVLHLDGRKLLFDPPAASMYGTLITGKSMEPETHAFLASVLPRVGSRVCFVDVGAAIGEMAIDAAGYANVDCVIGFDPDPDNAAACRRSALLNGFDHLRVIEKVVADAVKAVHFQMHRHRGQSGQIRPLRDDTTEELTCTTLDREVPLTDREYVLKIDVEGAESLVLRGSRRLLQEKKPLVIFEYITGRDGHMQEIVDALGPGYEIFRLRPDGRLDRTFTKTWNCVAVHAGSVFLPICRQLLS